MEVAASEDGRRIDKVLCARMGVSFALAQKWLRTGSVRMVMEGEDPRPEGAKKTATKKVDGSHKVAVGEKYTLPFSGARPIVAEGGQEGEELSFDVPEAPERTQLFVSERDAKDLKRSILFINEDLIIMNKPAGLATQGGSKINRHLDGLLHALQFESAEPPRLVHRLDKDASGCLVLARNRKTAQDLGKMLVQKQLAKIYWAILFGKPDTSEGQIRAPVSKVSVQVNDVQRMVIEDDPNKGMPATSDYKIVDAAGHVCSLAELKPITGRKHQLRLHCADVLRCPIVGDAKYGTEEVCSNKSLLDILRRRRTEPVDGDPDADGEERLPLMLHSKAVVFPFPLKGDGKVELIDGGKRSKVTAPLPAHMASVCKYFQWPSQ
jgi:23S rRNA pseudouridine955/2504/2580 synthase